MIDPLVLAAVAAAAVFASTLAAVAGFGGAAVMLPVLVWAFDVRDAIPILTVVQMIGNGSRVWFNRRELALPVVGWFALGAIPLAVLGAATLANTPTPLLRRLLGAFLLFTVAYRHTTVGQQARVGLRGFVGVGVAHGFLSALLGAVGPLTAPFFLAYGLVKGAYIGTEALASFLTHIVKLVAYGGYGILAASSMVTGVAVGVFMILGSYLGKRLLDRLPERWFPPIVEAVLVVSGLQFLLRG